MGYVAQVLFAILSFVAMALVVIGTPLEQFRYTDEYKALTGEEPCINYWGYKVKCSDVNYEYRPDKLFIFCKGRDSRFKAASACSIISICCLAVAFVLCLLTCCCSCCCPCCKYILGLLCLVAFACSLISWSIMLDAYLQSMEDTIPVCNKLKEYFKLGVGWALTVVGSIVALINAFVVCIPC